MIVAQREYLKMVKSKAFWISVLLIPFFMLIVGLVSGYSNMAMEEKLKTEGNNARSVIIKDDSGLLEVNLLKQMPNVSLALDKSVAVKAVTDNTADLFIYYPVDILQSNKIEIYSQDKGIMSLGLYDEFAKTMIKQNILQGIDDPEKILLFNANLTVDNKLFKDGQPVSAGFERFIIPIASIALYFLFTSISSSYLLMSVSEEKENRMIEIVLSIIKPRDLILGKVIGQVAAILTQIIVLITLIVFALKVTNYALPIDLSQLDINPLQLIMAVIYLLCGFMILAFTMVGVGAAMPTYREANSFSSVFIMLSIFPIYFVTVIFMDPTGLLAQITSYFPYTAPMILMLRSALNALSPFEMVLSVVILLLYIYGISQIAYRLFRFGAMEYSQKISFKSFIANWKQQA